MGRKPTQAVQDHGVPVTIIVTGVFGVVFSLFGWAAFGLLDPVLDLLPPALKFCIYAAVLTFAGGFAYATVTLGGAQAGNEHRLRYLDFRASLADNGIGSFYANGVSRALAWVDRFFGDADKAGQGLWPRAFGLRKPAPLWTAQSYDRCLLIALLYPIFVVFIGWVVSGEALGVEQALMMRDATFLERGGATVALMLANGLLVKAHTKSGKAQIALMATGGLLVILPMQMGSGAVCLAVGLAFIGVDDDANTGVIAICIAVGIALAGGFIFTSGQNVSGITVWAFSGIGVFAGSCTAAFAFAMLISIARRSEMHIIALASFTAIMLAATLVMPIFDIVGSSDRALTLLFFFGLLTLVNAPFDWLALGISRGLLRRGLQQGGLTPLWLGLLDIALSLVLMTMLAIAVLWSAELFDWMTLRSGNPPTLDPEAMLAELRLNATLGNTHYWWLYAMLFSTQIPALVNLLFGVFCLLRGLTGVNNWLLARLPETGGIGVWQRLGMASVWSGQLSLAVALGLVGVYGFFSVLIPAIDPAFGSRLIDLLDGLRFLPIRPPGTLVG